MPWPLFFWNWIWNWRLERQIKTVRKGTPYNSGRAMPPIGCALAHRRHVWRAPNAASAPSVERHADGESA
jgi:hypothetical protein